MNDISVRIGFLLFKNVFQMRIYETLLLNEKLHESQQLDCMKRLISCIKYKSVIAHLDLYAICS